MSQHNIFLQGEGDAWFMRNEAPAHDQPPMWAITPLVTFVDDTSTVLEIGCSDGRNLAWLAADRMSGAGVDPSDVAIATGLDRHPRPRPAGRDGRSAAVRTAIRPGTARVLSVPVRS